MKQEKNRNLEHLLHIAQGFYDIGFSVAHSNSSDKSITGFQRLPAAVVNFNFAVELTLKGLHLLTTGKNLEGHELWNLYKQLPLDIKTEIEDRFLELRNQKNDKLSSYRISMTRAEEETKDGGNTDKLSLKEFLILHNNSFINWRYLYEIKEEGYLYEYNFKQMNDFMKALYETLNKRSKGRTPTMSLEKTDTKA